MMGTIWQCKNGGLWVWLTFGPETGSFSGHFGGFQAPQKSQTGVHSPETPLLPSQVVGHFVSLVALVHHCKPFNQIVVAFEAACFVCNATASTECSVWGVQYNAQNTHSAVCKAQPGCWGPFLGPRAPALQRVHELEPEPDPRH